MLRRRFGRAFPNRLEDLLHDFYLDRVLGRTFDPPADPRARFLAFRGFLSGLVRQFCAKQWPKLVPQLALVSADSVPERGHVRTAEREFERQWALSIVKLAYVRLRDRHAEPGRLERFTLLAPFVIGPVPDPGETAAKLGLPANALRQAVHKLREELRSELRRIVADTLDFPDPFNSRARERAIDREIEHLRDALLDDYQEIPE
jgi:RNA polymerase sigma-70 factor (ECF subfamily)